jgi:hypothetical protein
MFLIRLGEVTVWTAKNPASLINNRALDYLQRPIKNFKLMVKTFVILMWLFVYPFWKLIKDCIFDHGHIQYKKNYFIKYYRDDVVYVLVPVLMLLL